MRHIRKLAAIDDISDISDVSEMSEEEKEELLDDIYKEWKEAPYKIKLWRDIPLLILFGPIGWGTITSYRQFRREQGKERIKKLLQTSALGALALLYLSAVVAANYAIAKNKTYMGPPIQESPDGLGRLEYRLA